MTPQPTAPQPTEPRHPALDLLSRYAAVLRAAWQARHELAGPRRLADETAFLPAALSLQETPVHPAPRRAMLAIVLLFVVALAWSWFGRVDVVAVAPGRIVVSERTKLIQPLETAVVHTLHVRDGDRVQAGQVLVELDPTEAAADRRSVDEQRRAAEADAQRAERLLQALATGRAPAAQPDPLLNAQLQAEWSDLAARLARHDAEQARRQAEQATVAAGIDKLRSLLPLARQREADVLNLAQQGFVAGHAGQDRTRERIELERDLADPNSSHDFGKDIIPKAVKAGKAAAHPFELSCVGKRMGLPPYWRDVGTIDAYWDANIDLTATDPLLNLYDTRWPIWTYQPQLPPAKFVHNEDTRRGMAIESLVSGGCIVSGHVFRSVLFSQVRVHSHAFVQWSVLLPGVTVGRGARLNRVVVDRGCDIPDGMVIGDDPLEDARRFHRTDSGICLVTREMLRHGDDDLDASAA